MRPSLQGQNAKTEGEKEGEEEQERRTKYNSSGPEQHPRNRRRREERRGTKDWQNVSFMSATLTC